MHNTVHSNANWSSLQKRYRARILAKVVHYMSMHSLLQYLCTLVFSQLYFYVVIGEFQFETSSRKYSLAFRSHGSKLHSLISMHDSSSDDSIFFISKPFVGSKFSTQKWCHFSSTDANLEIISLGFWGPILNRIRICIHRDY